MLPPANRLRRAVEIQQVRQQGRSWHHPLFILIALPKDGGHGRFAFVAGRRVGNAVVRNRAKRLLREAVRLHLSRVNAGWDCVVIARSKTPTATFAEVETAVCQLLVRAGVAAPAPTGQHS